LKLRILMLARDLATGTLTYTKGLIDSLQKAGEEVVVAYSGRNVPVLPCDVMTLDSGLTETLREHDLAQLLRFLLDARKLKQTIKQFRPHLVFSQGLDDLALTAVLASHLYRIQAATFVHDLTLRELRLSKGGISGRFLYPLALLRQRLVATQLSAILVSSRFMRSSLRRSLGIEAAVTPLGVPREFFGMPVTKKRPPFRLIFVGNLTPKKMPEVAIKALAYVAEIDVSLALVGDGPMKSELQELCQNLKLTEKVKFESHLSESELLRELGSAHASIVPSIWEGFGLAALEAMAAGVPVIASSSGALPEIVIQGKNGLLFAPGDSKDLAMNIRRLAQDEVLWNAMADSCRRWAREYTWEKTAASTLDAIGRVIGKN